MTHGEFIKALGGGTVVADWLTANTDSTVDREAVYKWGEQQVPWKWRGYLLAMAKEKGLSAPDDFLPGVAA